MFGKLTDLTGTKTIGDALSFYFFHVVFVIGLTSVLGVVLTKIGLVDTLLGTGGGDVSIWIGTLFVLLLSTSILSGKKLTGDVLGVILTVVGVVVSYHISVFLGLLVVSYLTTLHGKG